MSLLQLQLLLVESQSFHHRLVLRRLASADMQPDSPADVCVIIESLRIGGLLQFGEIDAPRKYRPLR